MDEALCAEFCRQYTLRMNELRMQHNASLSGYRAEAVKLERERQQIIKSISDGVPGELLRDRAVYVQKRREELEIILASEKEVKVLFHPNMANRYQKEIGNLVATLSDSETKSQAALILRSLIDKVVLTPKQGEKGLTIDLIGDLAGILSIATSLDRDAVSAELSKLQPVQHDADTNISGDELEREAPRIPKESANFLAMLVGSKGQKERASVSEGPGSLVMVAGARSPLALSFTENGQSKMVAGARSSLDLLCSSLNLKPKLSL